MFTSRHRLVAAAVAASSCALLPLSDAQAANSTRWSMFPTNNLEDGVYGRLDGYWDISLKFGQQIPLNSIKTAAISIGSSVHLYSTVGLTFDVHDNFENDAQRRQHAALGLELRPLFLPRWLLGHQAGPAIVDLSLDSVAVGAGGTLRRSGMNSEPASDFWLSLGAGLPLLGRAWGPWIEVRAVRYFNRSQPDAQDEATVLNLFFSWHGFLSWHHDG